jgi:predicted amidohydrolase
MPVNQRTRIAVGQLRMRWTIEENVDAILCALQAASKEEAQLCAFPELALTGFHREIVGLAQPEKVDPQVQRIAAECERLRIAAAFGTPAFDAGARFNSFMFVDERGCLTAAIHKNGLTPAEATFFDAGSARPIADVCGLRCSAVICREIEDHDEIAQQLPRGSVDVVFWPGLMGPDRDKPPQDPPQHVVQAQEIARSLDAFVVQSNWPNALNRPEQSADTGHSAVISKSGELLFRLPKEESGVAVFDLGERRFGWMPMP